MNAEVLQGVLQGESMGDIAKRLAKTVGMDETAAIRNARTMVTSAECKGRQDSYIRAQKDGIVMQRRWIATKDARTRHWHAELDGALAEVDEPFENAIGKIMYPGDPSADGANVYNCRCTIAAKVLGFKKVSGNTSANPLTPSRGSGIMYGDKITRSVGARSISYPVVNYPETDIPVEFVTGTRPVYPPDHTMAGNGCKTGREIDDIDRLVDTYKCDAKGWRKEKAIYEVYDENGEIRNIEIHWYEHKDIGKVEYKVKTRGGYVYIDEWPD